MPVPELPLTKTAERRTSTRHPCDLSVLAGCEPCVVRVHNLSREGICFFTGQELKSQSPVTVELFNAVACVWHLKGARVIHATVQPDGSWLVGVAFLNKLTQAELQNLLESSPIPCEMKSVR